MSEDTKTIESILAPAVLESASYLRERFLAAKPFPHTIVDEFFVEPFARELVNQFPAFDNRFAIDEFGRVGGKAVVSTLTALGPAYRRTHDYFSSQPFLDWLGEVTGIQGLLYDEENFGGGTHENINGQGLLPHVDFNYHPTTHYHRRLNLIVYLNEGWQAEWGGSIRLHADPREPSHDQSQSYAPEFNRCIVFETSEYSWHSFDRIVLPAEESHRTRKSLSIYFYTRDRSEETTFAEHTTFYIPRPLPPEFHVGRSLSESDVNVLARVIGERDELLKIHQLREAQREPATVEAGRFRVRITELRSALRLPLIGYVRQIGRTKGFYEDGWAAGAAEFTIEPECDVVGCTLRADVPEHFLPGNCVWLEVNGVMLKSVAAAPGPITLHCAMQVKSHETAAVRIVTSSTMNPKALGLSDDIRDLGLRIETIAFHHPLDQIEAFQGQSASEQLASNEARDETHAMRLGTCPICTESNVEIVELGEVKPTHPGPFHVETFRLARCERCESVFLDPRPTAEDLHLLYSHEGQYSSAIYTDDRRVAAILEYLSTVLQRIQPKPDSRCLEVGAGLAWMSRACKAFDPSIVTIAQDVSAEAAQHCPWTDRYYVGPIETLPERGPFDLISMTHVIEHLVTPLATLRHVATLLAPGGKLFVTGPYRPGGDTEASLARWETYSYLHVPAHLTYFSKRWFHKLAEQTGLELESWNASHEGGDAFEVILERSASVRQVK